MMTSSNVPVGATPVRRFRTWGDHRHAMSEAADAVRTRRSATRASVEVAQRPLGGAAAEAIAVFDDTEPRTTKEIAAALGITPRNAFYALSELRARSEIRKKKVKDGAVVWWRPKVPAAV